MDSYTSEWNKETVMANATRLLHITQELAVDAVPKYTKKQYARLGFGSSSLMNMNEEDELALVQEAYTIAWKYLNLTLEYTPIARTTLKLHTHHGALGNFIGTLGQDNRVLVGDNQGIYVCSSSGYMMARWYKPHTARTSTYPNSTTAYTGRVLTGTRTSTPISGWPTDLDAMTDVERMSLEEPVSILLRSDYWWLTWYPKQQYMMIHKSESTTSCNPPSEVTWSYRVAPSSYQQFVFYSKDWQATPSTQTYTTNFRTQLPRERHQTDYAYEIRNDRGGFEWVEIKGTLPVYKCPPMLLKYFQNSFPHVQFEGDSSLEENNLYMEILDSIEDPRDVGGFMLWENPASRYSMNYLQAEFFAVPLDELFPIRQNSCYTRSYKFPEPRHHSSGQVLTSAANSPTWVYTTRDHPNITRSSPSPAPEFYIGDIKYTLAGMVDPARNVQGFVIYPTYGAWMATKATNGFDDTGRFYLRNIALLGVKYTAEGDAYAICVMESTDIRDWTHPYRDLAMTHPREARLFSQTVTGLDWTLLSDFVGYRGSRPELNITSYKFYVQLDGRPHPSGIGGTSGKDLLAARLLKPDAGKIGLPYHNFWVYSRESGQYQFMLNTPTGNSGFYKPDLPVDTYTFPKTSEVF